LQRSAANPRPKAGLGKQKSNGTDERKYRLQKVGSPVPPEQEEGILSYIEQLASPFTTMGYGGFRFPSTDKFRFVKRLQNVGAICYYVVDTVEQALRAEDAGVDGLIVTGAEAGGVRLDTAPHIFTLLQAVRKRTDLPLVAAGGIADGIGMAGAFALGAEGVLMGTRFMAAVESPLHPKWKEEVVAADEVFHLPYVDGMKMMAVRNPYSEKVYSEHKSASPDEHFYGNANPYFGDAKACFYEGRTDLAITGTGETAMLVDSVQTVAEIMEDTIAGFWNAIDRLKRLG